MSQLADLGIPYIEKKVSEIREEGGILSAVVLEDGSIVPAERGSYLWREYDPFRIGRALGQSWSTTVMSRPIQGPK